MLKIGIELPDEKLSGVDLSKPEMGNPGVGGSEYLFALLASELAKKGTDITVYHYGNNKISPYVKNSIVKNNVIMLQTAEQDEIDILIHQVGKPKEWYDRLAYTGIKSVAWAHVYLEYCELKLLRVCENVKRVVFVGKEEYDAYIDDDIIKKATYIFNMLPTEQQAGKRHYDKPVVTYVGSLVPAKGFHKLAEIWPEVLRRIPNAELNVIGNGKVYNRSAKLGKYGIAEEKYETSFMKYLIDERGEILPSVHFLGLIGTEKTEIFKETAAGIVNPTALTETFCMSAVEMEYAYIPVVSKRKWGLLDTVKDKKTGFLFDSKTEFINSVVALLEKTELNAQMGDEAHRFVTQTFPTEKIIPQWLELLIQVDKGSVCDYLEIQGNWSNDYKWIKQCIRILRFNLKLSFLPTFYDIKYVLKRLLRR